MAMSAVHSIAYAHLLELALRLELLKDTKGFAKVRRAISTDPRADQLAHAQIQLEIATLALKVGSVPELEPNPTRRRPADVAFEADRRRLVVETRAFLTSDAWRQDNRRTDALFDQIHAIELTYGVRCEGEITADLIAAGHDWLVSALEDRARLVAIGACAPPMRVSGAALTVARDSGDATGRGLRGPELAGDSWTRLGPRIAEKADKAVESGVGWLRLDALDGLWQFTHWAARPLAAKLQAIAALVRNAAGGLEGVILSSGALFEQGKFEDEHVRLPGGLVAVRRRLAPLRVRETLIIVCEPDAPTDVADWWLGLYADEPQWLGWGLARFGLATPDEVFAR
jgi:hypothetical protein